MLRVRRARRFLHARTAYRVRRLLGLGREGIVFDVEVGGGPSGERRALKFLDSREGRGLSRRKGLKRAIDGALAELGLEAWPCLPRVFELSVIEGGGHAYPIEVMERVEGRTVMELVREGALAGWDFQERVRALDELLEGLAALSSRGVTFVHIDADNLMVTPERRFRLIDLSSFRLKPLTPRRRRRFFRRFARTARVLFEDCYEKVLAGEVGAAAAGLFARLEAYRDLPKGERPSPDMEFHSLGELHQALREAFGAGDAPRAA